MITGVEFNRTAMQSGHHVKRTIMSEQLVQDCTAATRVGFEPAILSTPCTELTAEPPRPRPISG